MRISAEGYANGEGGSLVEQAGENRDATAQLSDALHSGGE